MLNQANNESINPNPFVADCADLGVNAWTTAAFVKVPSKLLGAILDSSGHASAAAAHLLAIKCSKGPGFVLNEKQVARPFEEGGYQIGQRRFRNGVRVLKRARVLQRIQCGKRSWAKEQLAESDGNFVVFPEKLLRRRSSLVAFLLIANLSPKPLRPSDVARRVGMTSPTTIRSLVKEPVETGEIAHETGQRETVWVARKGYKFDLVKNDLAKNDSAKNGGTHSKMEERTVDGSESQKEAPPSSYRTSSCEDAGGKRVFDKAGSCNSGPEWIILSDWKATKFFRDNELQFSGEPKIVAAISGWKEWLELYAKPGQVPAHLYSPGSYRQMLEIVHELSARLHALASHDRLRVRSMRGPRQGKDDPVVRLHRAPPR
jgi:hypothetical protein